MTSRWAFRVSRGNCPIPGLYQGGSPAPRRRRELWGLEPWVHDVVAERAAGRAGPAAAELDGFGRLEGGVMLWQWKNGGFVWFCVMKFDGC